MLAIRCLPIGSGFGNSIQRLNHNYNRVLRVLVYNLDKQFCKDQSLKVRSRLSIGLGDIAEL